MGKRSGNNQFDKVTLEDVKRVINNMDLILLTDQYINNTQKLVLKDNEGYFYVGIYDRLNNGIYPRKFHKSNPFTIRNIGLWCKLNNKPFELISEKYYGNHIPLEWKCLKDNCKENFKCTWSNIHKGEGCGVCHGKQVAKSNCLATKNPELAKQWHPIKNKKLTPWDVTYMSNQKVWWQCLHSPKHEWYASICGRKTSECPYCSGFYVSEENNLMIDNPDLCKEWNYTKNKSIPEKYHPHSGKRVWWKCSECGNEWKAKISDRNGKDNGRGRGCPECNKSHGEKIIKKWLDLNGINYTSQKTFDNLFGLKGKNLSYDFYLPDFNLLVEYQGEFHDGNNREYTSLNLVTQQEHDKRKHEYALKHNIKLLEIWYWDFDNIEKILEEKLLK